MRNTAGFGQLLGWVSVVLGAACIAIGIFAGGRPDYGALQRCETEVALGRRMSPCESPPDRIVLLAFGGGAMTSGLFFLLLSGILTTLVDLREDAQRQHANADAAARAAERMRGQPGDTPAATVPLRYTHSPGPADQAEGRIGDAPPITLPSRYEMMVRHGEAVGGPAPDAGRTEGRRRNAGIRGTAESAGRRGKARLGHLRRLRRDALQHILGRDPQQFSQRKNHTGRNGLLLGKPFADSRRRYAKAIGDVRLPNSLHS